MTSSAVRTARRSTTRTTSPRRVSPRTLTLRGASRLDAVSLTHDGGTTLTHGGTGGTAASLTLASGEHLTSVKLTQGQKDGRTRIFSAAFTTDKGRTLASGTATSATKTFTAPVRLADRGLHRPRGQRDRQAGRAVRADPLTCGPTVTQPPGP